jgi:hypothetical protein
VGHDHADAHSHAGDDERRLRRLAASATTHCLTGCAIGEVLGMVIATALGWGNAASIALAVVLAFVFGYSFTLRPLVAGGVPLASALGIALAVAWVAAFPVNLWLLRRGRGHALVHAFHDGRGGHE